MVNHYISLSLPEYHVGIRAYTLINVTRRGFVHFPETASTTQSQCEDMLLDCAALDRERDVCNDLWDASMYCPRFCDVCDERLTSPAPPSKTTTVGIAPTTTTVQPIGMIYQ